MYTVTNVPRYTSQDPIPIRLCDNTQNQLTTVCFRMTCGHFIQQNPVDIICRTCNEGGSFCPYCPNCHKDYAACIYYSENHVNLRKFYCYFCERRTDPCQAISSRRKRCTNKAAYNNGGFCATHFCPKRIKYWVTKGFAETSLSPDLLSVLLSYLQLKQRRLCSKLN